MVKRTPVLRKVTAPRIQTLARADAILAAIAGSHGRETGLTAIAAATGLHKNTAFTLLKTLEQLGYVVQNSETHGYRIGARLFEFARLAEAGLDVAQLARPTMMKLLGLANESVSLAIPGTFDALIVSTVESTYAVRGSRFQGQHAPYHASAVGKAMLAFMTDADRSMILDRASLNHRTRRTISSREALLQELAAVRKAGFAVSLEEEETGANAVGAPILSRLDEVIGAIAVWGPTTRLPASKLSRLGQQLVTLCTEIRN